MILIKALLDDVLATQGTISEMIDVVDNDVVDKREVELFEEINSELLFFAKKLALLINKKQVRN